MLMTKELLSQARLSMTLHNRVEKLFGEDGRLSVYLCTFSSHLGNSRRKTGLKSIKTVSLSDMNYITRWQRILL